MFRLLLILILLIPTVRANDFVIYSISHEVPMGYENEVLKKNFYVNIGANQGLREGTTLDVFRQISVSDPFQSKERYNYKVKVGELAIIHVEENAAIGSMKSIRDKAEDPLFEIKNFMIGDVVAVHIK